MDKDTVILAEQVGKTYHLGKIGGSTLQHQFQSWLALRLGREDPNRRIGGTDRDGEAFEALHDVSFQVQRGERVGLIGQNGAGKSTLLKLLSRVTAPTAGRISIRGRVSSMLEVGTGFHPELTGRENIYLNGAILGMKQREVDEKIAQIIAFSECEKFIDTPVKRYSSGMYVRLAFAVAAHLNADIFLMDEVLAVGDMQFQQKCLRKMRQISEDGSRTILYVSHNMRTIRALCDRCLVLDHGAVLHDGSVEEGIARYMKQILEVRRVYTFSEREEGKGGTGGLVIRRVELADPVISGEQDTFTFSVSFDAAQAFRGYHLRFTVHDAQDEVVGSGISEAFSAGAGRGTVTFAFAADLLVPGLYSADLVVVEPQGDEQIRHACLEHAIAFRVEERDRLYHVNWHERTWGSVRFADLAVTGQRKS